MALGAPFFPGAVFAVGDGVGAGCGVSVGLGVTLGLGVAASSGVAVGEGDADGLGRRVGDLFFRFDFAACVGLGDGVGEIFFFGDAVGDGLGVDFFAERFRCFRVGVGVGVGSRNFIFVPNDSSAASGAAIVQKKIATIRKTRSIALIAGNKNQRASS